MRTIPKGSVPDIKRDEGYSARPYRDTEGHLTIGYGTLIREISEEEALLLLNHRLKVIWTELCEKKLLVTKLPPSVQRALCNMAYNLGVPRLLRFTKMWKALEAKDYQTAATEALDSKWASQVGKRAERIAEIIRS